MLQRLAGQYGNVCLVVRHPGTYMIIQRVAKEYDCAHVLIFCPSLSSWILKDVICAASRP